MLGKKSLAVHLDSIVPPLSTPGGRLGGGVATALSGLGAATSLAWASLRALRHPRIYLPLTFAQVWEIGIASLPLVLLVAMISGAVTSEQTGYQYSSTLPPGDTLAARNVPTLAETFASVGTQASEAFARASDLLSPDHVAGLERGAKSLSHSVDELSALSVALRATAMQVRRRVDDARLDSTVIDLARTARSLTGTSMELKAASVSLGSILDKIDRGNGSLGRAVNDPTLYQAMLSAATHVDQAALGAAAFVQDVHTRPQRYIRISLF